MRLPAHVLITQRGWEHEKLGFLSVLEDGYMRYFDRRGILVTALPNGLSDPAAVLERLRVTHLVLSGGNDIAPSLYGQKNRHATGICAVRDRTEKALLRRASEMRLPVLGI